MNLAGVTKMGAFQLITTILKFIPLVFIATIGLDPGAFVKEATIAIVTLLISFWFVFGPGQQATFDAYLLILLGYVVLLGLYVKRKKSGGVVEEDSSAPTTRARCRAADRRRTARSVPLLEVVGALELDPRVA